LIALSSSSRVIQKRGQPQNAVSIGSGREHDSDAQRLVIFAALNFEGERADGLMA
jgi:hypothetical protein